MKLRPTIFLSGVSSEFGSFRDAVEVEVQKKGCFADNQSSFGVDYRTVEEMLRRRINDADAVIHIVGFRFGAEPKDRPPDKPRRSYTQMEYDIARELEKPVYVFLSSDVAIGDALGVDDAEATALQLVHRQAIQNSNPLFYFFKDKAELCKLAGEIDAVTHADFRVDISRIDKYAPAELIGRNDELALLDAAWLKVRRAEPKRPHILTFVALGGEGKTSLVAKWLADLAYQNWPGCDSAFAWSFYSQGTREQYASSSDLFLKEAITFFGDAADKEFAASAAGAYEKGQRLARIVGARRSLLILDGLEPLQYAPTSPTPGELKDGGISALLRGLAARSDGLCIVTTRYSLPNLKAFWQTTASEITLTRLSQAAGVHLLKTFGVKGSAKEFEALVEDVKGHALTLNLLGTYLRDAHGGDIRRRDLIKLEEADAEEQGGHAFRVMEAYQRAFDHEGYKGQRALAILKLLGLFNRPVSTDCLGALLEKPAIAGLTEPLVGMSEAQRNLAFNRLKNAKLLTENREPSGALISLDAHPLFREYFARQLRTHQLEAWRAAHKRIYEHLCATTPDKPKPTLEDLQPLYQAVAHGCQAGMEQEAMYVYHSRIQRVHEAYSLKKIGAFGSDLGVFAYFFENAWSQLSPRLNKDSQAWVFNETSLRLRALGRLTEALEPMKSSLAIATNYQDWNYAAVAASNLSELEMILGEITSAVMDGEHAVTFADRSNNTFHAMSKRTTHADALHQAGFRTQALARFREAEQIQSVNQPNLPLLYAQQGFRYCDLLLASSERSSWQRTLGLNSSSSFSAHSDSLRVVFRRATQTVDWCKLANASLISMTLEYLTLNRITLYQYVLSGRAPRGTRSSKAKSALEDTLNGFRRVGARDFLLLGLLTRTWLRYLVGERTGSDSAQEDLDEAWEIAERGPMRLHMADIHLYRARLFFREKEYLWASPEADLAAARKLIEQCGYWRRKEELEDAERVILKKSAK